MSPLVAYTLLYILLCFCVIYPPVEFISSGITIPTLFSSILGSETEQFIIYHIKRSLITLLVYSCLPVGYVFGLWLFDYQNEILFLWESTVWQIFVTSSLVFPILALYQISVWTRDNYKDHPIVINISKFCNNNSDWWSVASDINTEYRRIEKLSIQTNPICKVVATENWILKITPLVIFVTHQSDASLSVNQSDTHQISHHESGEVQYVNIEVKSSRNDVKPFNIRLNALDFRDLQDRVARTITVLPNVNFHKTLIDRFIDTFKEIVQENQRYTANQELENCFGCMQALANVKLQKLCTNSGNAQPCVTCYCRPMWCIDCLARWFASRQDADRPDTWLSSKCTCAMCRAQFCILDVCLIDN